MSQRENNIERIEIPCAYGMLVAEVVGDPGIYDEIEIDLVRPDGSLMQLCVAGTETFEGKPCDLHVYVWDGSDECATTYINPSMQHDYWY